MVVRRENIPLSNALNGRPVGTYYVVPTVRHSPRSQGCHMCVRLPVLPSIVCGVGYRGAGAGGLSIDCTTIYSRLYHSPEVSGYFTGAPGPGRG